MAEQITLEQAVAVALQHHQAGRLAQAEGIYRRVLSKDPAQPEALRLLGVIARQSGQFDAAIDLISRSISANPLSPEAHTNLGDVLRSQGQLDKAIAAYSHAVKLKPDWAEAYGALGNALRERGRFDEAEQAFNICIQLKPNLAEGHLNLGNVLSEQGRRPEAIAAYQRAIELKPDLAQSHNNLGNVLWDDGKLDEAVAAYDRAIQIRPGYPDANWSKGKILALGDRKEEALACFDRVVQHDSASALGHLNLARMLAKMNRRDDAAAEYRRAIELNPDAADWRYELAAFSGDAAITQAPASYVRKLFDGYASHFDEHLVDRLQYRAPQLIQEDVFNATANRTFTILDLGCGTGLCGVQFQSHAKEMVGVDLSPAMIATVAARGIYTQLITGDLLPALESKRQYYDLILAGDVLVYIGDLSVLFPAVAAALCPGGLFAFSIETHDGQGFVLQPHERFAHSFAYVRDLAKAHGLLEISARSAALRMQRNVEASSAIFVLQKPA